MSVVHFAESSLDAHVHGRKVRVGCHDANDTASDGVKAGSNYAKDDIFAGEDTSDGALVLNKDSGCVVLLHELGSLLDRRPDGDGCWRQSGQDGLECRTRHLLADRLDVLDNLLGLAGAHLGLHALQGIVELARRAVCTLELLHGIVEALCDVEDAGDVVVLVHDGQMAEALADHEVEGICCACVRLCAEGVLCHDLGDGDVLRLLAASDDAESQILCCEDAGDMVVFVCDQYTVFPLGGHELCGLCDGGRSRDLEGWAGLQGQDGARRSLASWAHAAAGVLLLVQVCLDLAADGLGSAGEQQALSVTGCVLTSSLLDCFARLALRVETPASLPWTWEAWVSRAGRGMPDGLSTNWARAGWLRFLGVPRMVPVCDMVAAAAAAVLRLLCWCFAAGRWC